MKHIKVVSVVKAAGIADGINDFFNGIVDFVEDLLKKNDDN